MCGNHKTTDIDTLWISCEEFTHKQRHVQPSSNPLRLSLERGWQLMWLCTGLFPPSPALMGHARRFLESRSGDRLAADCLQRLREMARSGSKANEHTLVTHGRFWVFSWHVCVCVCF